MFGRDKCYRPNLVLNAPRLMAMELDTKHGMSQEDIAAHMLKAVVFTMEYMKKHLHMDGKVENYNMIIDLKDMGVT